MVVLACLVASVLILWRAAKACGLGIWYIEYESYGETRSSIWYNVRYFAEHEMWENHPGGRVISRQEKNEAARQRHVDRLEKNLGIK